MRIIVTAFLTVASEDKKSGHGIIIWSELVRRARAAGFDGVMSYSVGGDPMADMMLGCFQRMSLTARRVFSVHNLIRLILPKPGRTAPPDLLEPGSGWYGEGVRGEPACRLLKRLCGKLKRAPRGLWRVTPPDAR